MRRFLSRRLIYILSLGLFVLFTGFTLPYLGEVRNKMVSEYFKHKEFLYNLQLAQRVKRKTADEDSLRSLLQRIRVKPEALYSSDSGIEIKLKLHWSKLPFLVKEVERHYRVLSLSAVDNTGKGLFEVRMVVR